jgi:hypothetical protein
MTELANITANKLCAAAMMFYTNNTQLLGNLLNVFNQGDLRFPEGRRPEGNLSYLENSQLFFTEFSFNEISEFFL